MNNKITTYKDLLLEKERLQLLLQTQKEVIRQDIEEVKEELVPIRNIVNTVSRMISKEPGNILLTGTIDTVIDLVVKKFLLARTGWVTKNLVPFFLKNYSSHIIEENKGTIMEKIFSFFKKKDKASSNGTMDHEEEESDE
jgi:2-keto-4-pentenoate hydratase/2-oxohepta-3-ene-1,7-dioic acid hydratase in catechol pathway